MFFDLNKIKHRTFVPSGSSMQALIIHFIQLNSLSMNRRTSLARMLGRNSKNTKNLAEMPVVATGLAPYNGTFGIEEAAHLLRRTTMGATYAQIQSAANNGLASTVSTLMTLPAVTHLPLNYSDSGDPNLPIGATWVNVPYNSNGSGRGDRKKSMDAWGMKLLIENNLSIREKMTLFWHNHFSIEKQKVSCPKYLYTYITLLRDNCLGNFKQLAKDVTVDPAMLYYLDGHTNTKNNPNENFAREVLELFTIGKGPTASPGDYTNYTEDDILELAKVFTGWKARGRFSDTITDPYPEFLSNNHDTTDKQLSHRFNNVVIPDMGDLEYAHAIDIIFQQNEVAYFICRKLYRYFVNFDLTTVESTVINDMAQCLLANNYDIAPVVEELLKSQHFFDVGMRGSVIKNPLEFVCNVMRQFEVPILTGTIDWYASFNKFNDRMNEFGMEIYRPPNVAGWPAYYLEPQFSELWVNSVTIRPREEFTSKVAQNGYNHSGFQFQIDPLPFIATLNNPLDPNSLITEIATLIFPYALNQTQIDFLKEILIPGLPDFEWTVEYSDYLANPGDQMLIDGVTTRLRNLFEAMLSMPEFHIL